jgi:flagellar motor protein MotB
MKAFLVLMMGSVAFTGCAAHRAAMAKSPALRHHLAQGRISEVTIVHKQTGLRKSLFGQKPFFQKFLEGYVDGTVTDWDGRPAEGVTVRLEWVEAAQPFSARPMDDDTLLEEALADDGGALSAVENARGGAVLTDARGSYRLPFSLPIERGKVEVKGKIIYSAGWEDGLAKKGRAFEPWIKEAPVELYYYKKMDLLAFSEGPRKSAVRLRETSIPTAARPEPKREKKPRGPRADGRKLFMDLQILMVTHHLDHYLALSRSKRGMTLSVKEDAVFAPGAAELLPNAEKALAPLARWLEGQIQHVGLELTGTRQPLGQQRVQKLLALLGNYGIDAGDVSTRSADAGTSGQGVQIVLSL